MFSRFSRSQVFLWVFERFLFSKGLKVVSRVFEGFLSVLFSRVLELFSKVFDVVVVVFSRGFCFFRCFQGFLRC